MSTFFSFLPLILNAIIILLLAKRRSVMTAFFLALLISFSIPNIFSTLVLNYAESIFLSASCIAILFFVVFLTIEVVFRQAKIIKTNSKKSFLNINDGMIYHISFCLFITSLILMMSTYDFSLNKMIESSWLDYRENESLAKTLATYLLYPASGLFLISIKTKRKLGVLLSFLYIAFAILVLKTRSYLIAIFIPWVIYKIMYDSWSVKKISVYAIVLCLGFTAYSLSRNFRHLGSLENVNNVELVFDLQEFELVDNVYFILNNEMKFSNNTFNDLRRLMSVALPASFFDNGKPRENAKIVWDEKTGVLNVEGSIHPTFIGNIILESKYLGWLVYAFILGGGGLFLDYLLFKYRYTNVLLFSSITTIGFFLARGAFYNGMLLLIFCFITISIFELLCRLIHNKGGERV